MRLLTNFVGIMAGLSLVAIPIALFSDTSTGENAYSVSEAFFAWILFSVVFTLLRRNNK